MLWNLPHIEYFRISLNPQVEVKRERITRLFFPIITLFLVIGIMLAISSPYLILQGSFMEGTTIGTLFFSFYMIGRLSHTGQTFISKVGLIASPGVAVQVWTVLLDG